MKVKRLLATLLVACMLFSILPVSVFAEETGATGKVYVDANATVEAGQSVGIDLHIENNPGLTALSVDVYYKTLTANSASTRKDKNNKTNAFGTFRNDCDSTVTVIDAVNPNDNAHNDRKDDGWSMAKFGYVLTDTAKKAKFKDNGVIGSIQFFAPADVETQDVAIELVITQSVDDKTPLSFVTGNGVIHINGKAPELDSVSVTPDKAEYGSNAKLKLTAKSTSGKDITSLVTFGVKDPKNNVVTESFNIAADGTFDIGTHDAGTYTVWADPKEGQCTYPTTGAFAPQATFEIIPKPITSATVTVTGFGKGLPVTGATATADNMTVARGWYTGEGVPSEANAATGNFAADSPYTLTLQLIPNKNYKLADDLTVTVRGLGDDQVIKHASNTLIVRARTTAKDATRFKGNLGIDNSKTPCYGDTLSQINLNTTEAQAVADIDGVETVIPGSFTWKDDTEKVGDAGGYRSHTVVFTPSGEYADLYEGFEKNISFYVQKKVLNISGLTWTWSNDTLTYTGKPQSITLNIPSDLDGLVDVTYDTTEGRTNTATDAGTYTVAATLTLRDAENYIFSGASSADGSSHTVTTTWKINKADWTYNAAQGTSVCYGPAQDVVITPASLGLPAEKCAAGITIDIGDGLLHTGYSIDEETGNVTISLRETTLAEATANARDTFELKYTFDNYNDVTITYTITITEKNSDTMTMKFTVDNVQYGIGAAPSFSELPAGVKADQVTITYSGNGQTYTSKTIATAPVGDYTATARYESKDTIYTATATFKILPRDISNGRGVTIDFGKSLTYNGTAQEQTMTVKVDNTPLTLGMDYELDTENGASLTQKDAGSYTVIIKGKGNYTGTKEATFTIDKATPAASDFTFTPPANLAYDGNPKAASVTTTNAKIGAVTVSYNPAVPTNAGNYTVSIDVAESDNYNAATGLTDSAWKFTITPAEITNAMVGSIGALTYTGEALTPALSVADLTAGTDYEVTYANNTDAGTASATVKGKDNYKGAVVRTFTINPANMSFAANMYVSRHTNVRTEQTITLQSITGVKGETLTPTVTLEAPASNDIFTVAPAYNAETGNVTFTLNGNAGSATYKVKLASPNSNYADGEYNLVFTASHRTVIAITFEDGSATYTSKPIRYETASAGESGTWTYTYVPLDGSGASLDAVTSLPLTVGTYNVTAHFENADHIGDKTVTFVIKKATPATPPEIKVDNTDTTLGELGNKMLVEIGVPGTIHWYGPDGKPITDPHTKIEANTEYTWKFIPADPDNYNSIEGKTTPYVRDDLSWLPGVLGGGSSFSFHDVNRFDYYYDSVKWAADNGIASGTSRFAFSPDAVCTRAQTVTFLWRAAGSPLPRYRVSPFTDVHAYDYYYEAVLWAVEQGITTGLTATTFGPDETVTRGQVATFLYRAASAAKPNTFNPFTDVKPTAYNYGAILWAYDNRITTGTSTTTFSPDAFCTRAQIVTFLYRYYQGR